MNRSFIFFLTIIVLNGDLLAQSFSPEVTLKSGVQQTTAYSFNPDYEQKNTLMHELEIFHPVFSSEKTALSFGINGSLRRESESLKTYDCEDCAQFDFKGQAFGTRLKLETTKTFINFGLYAGINLNQVSINQTRFGMLPVNIQPGPLISFEETFTNLDTGIRLDVPLYQMIYFSGDLRLYQPLDNSDFNQQRTAFSFGLSLKF